LSSTNRTLGTTHLFGFPLIKMNPAASVIGLRKRNLSERYSCTEG
jgi:hypothetical protein